MKKSDLERIFGADSFKYPGTLEEEKKFIFTRGVNPGFCFACDEDDNVLELAFYEEDKVLQTVFAKRGIK